MRVLDDAYGLGLSVRRCAVLPMGIDGQNNEYRVGEEIALPRSAIVDNMGTLNKVAVRNNAMARVVAHGGDGNLYPRSWVDPDDGAMGKKRLNTGLNESIWAALDVGGTVTAERGVGTVKQGWLAWEQPAEVLKLQRKIGAIFDPQGISSPGKAIF